MAVAVRLCESQTKNTEWNSGGDMISPSSVNMPALSKQWNDSEVFVHLKKKKLKNAPFDLILALQEKRHSFVSLADIPKKTAHFGKLYLAKPRNERF